MAEEKYIFTVTGDHANKILICPVPVGGIFITKLTDNPAVRYPGTTWEKLEGRFLYGTSGQEESGATGGSSSVVLSVENMPAHTHALTAKTDESGSHTHTSGNHRHKVDSHSHTQPSHSHSVKMSDRNDSGNPNYLFAPNGGNYGMESAASGNGWDNQVQQEVKARVVLPLIPAIQIRPRLKTEPTLTD